MRQPPFFRITLITFLLFITVNPLMGRNWRYYEPWARENPYHKLEIWEEKLHRLKREREEKAGAYEKELIRLEEEKKRLEREIEQYQTHMDTISYEILEPLCRQEKEWEERAFELAKKYNARFYKLKKGECFLDFLGIGIAFLSGGTALIFSGAAIGADLYVEEVRYETWQEIEKLVGDMNREFMAQKKKERDDAVQKGGEDTLRKLAEYIHDKDIKKIAGPGTKAASFKEFTTGAKRIFSVVKFAKTGYETLDYRDQVAPELFYDPDNSVLGNEINFRSGQEKRYFHIITELEEKKREISEREKKIREKIKKRGYGIREAEAFIDLLNDLASVKTKDNPRETEKKIKEYFLGKRGEPEFSDHLVLFLWELMTMEGKLDLYFDEAVRAVLPDRFCLSAFMGFNDFVEKEMGPNSHHLFVAEVFSRFFCTLDYKTQGELLQNGHFYHFLKSLAGKDLLLYSDPGYTSRYDYLRDTDQDFQKLMEEAGLKNASAKQERTGADKFLAPRSLFAQNDDHLGGVSLDYNRPVGAGSLLFSTPASLTIKEPVLLSLGNLLDRLKDYTDRWKELPVVYRYPGSMARIHGILFRENELYLLGEQLPGVRGFDVDDLIRAIRTVWKEGKSPGCSLDPLPYDFGGPQYTRVMEVGENSRFARIMLEADYLMKKILTFGAEEYGVKGYLSLDTLIAREAAGGESEESTGRFWFYPHSLGSGNLWRSGKNLFFNTGLRVLTEEMSLVRSGLKGTGKANHLYADAARYFTEFYPLLEESLNRETVSFKKLHTLFDLTAACALLKVTGGGEELLEKYASLPLRDLEGAEAVPPYYPGIVHEVPGTDIITSGGVDIAPGGTLLKSRVAGAGEIPPPVETPAEVEARELVYFPDSPVILKGGFDPLQARRELLYEQGWQWLSEASYKEAVELFTFLVEEEQEPGACSYLGLACLGAGEYEKASLYLEKGLRYAPGDPFLERVYAMLRELSGIDKKAEGTPGEPEKKELALMYKRSGEGLLSLGFAAGAVRAGEHALRLDPRDPGIRLFLAEACSAREEYERGWQLILQCRKFLRKLLKNEKNNSELKRLLARSLVTGVDIRMKRYGLYSQNSGAGTENMLLHLEQVIKECEEAYTLDPGNPSILDYSFMARYMKILIFEISGRESRFQGIAGLAEKLMREHPGLAAGFGQMALVLFHKEEYEDARSYMEKALALNSRYAPALVVKGRLLMREKKWNKALEALSRASRLDPRWRGLVADDLKLCTEKGKKQRTFP